MYSSDYKFSLAPIPQPLKHRAQLINFQDSLAVQARVANEEHARRNGHGWKTAEDLSRICPRKPLKASKNGIYMDLLYVYMDLHGFTVHSNIKQ